MISIACPHLFVFVHVRSGVRVGNRRMLPEHRAAVGGRVGAIEGDWGNRDVAF